MTLIHICTNRQRQIHTQDIHPKATEYLHIENYKTLMKEIKEDTNDGEIYHVHGSEESI